MIHSVYGVYCIIDSNSSARLRIDPGAWNDYGLDVYTSVGWHHYVIQVDPSTDPKIKIYLDGNLVYTVAYSQSSMIDWGYLMYFGQSQSSWHTYISLDSLRVSNIPRYGSNFEVPTELTQDSHTVSLFNFFEDTKYDTKNNLYWEQSQGTVTYDNSFGREPHTSSLKLYPGRILIKGNIKIDTAL